VLVPLSTSSGEELQHRVGETSLVEKHQELADTLIWFVIPLTAVAILGYWMYRRASTGKALVAVVAVAAVLLSGATLVDVGLIGHSGAKASWSKVADKPASNAGDSDE
jgi:apolipoprotein N-acyltransferase